MKRSKYTYFFETDHEYAGYAYLSDNYSAFPLKIKNQVERILQYPDDIVTNADVNLFKELVKNKFLIKDDFNEYNFIQHIHRQYIHKSDNLAFCIVPTLACNCRCNYCYELHPKLSNSKMSREVVNNLKNYILKKAPKLNSLNIGWFGGEPLLCMDIIKEVSEFCIDVCKKNNISEYIGQMVSNGVLLNKRNAQILSDCQMHKIQLTLDGSKETHDKIRISANGKPTFEIILKNIINYLDIDERNRIKLRIHISLETSEQEISKIINTLERFDRKFRQRIYAYTHVLFSACSEEWAGRCKEDCTKTENLNLDGSKTHQSANLTAMLHQEIMRLDFGTTAYSQKNAYLIACEFDTDWVWALRPDGYLNKCTVGIEKERSVAKLTKNGIEIFPERYSKISNKEFSSVLNTHCQDCEYIIFCWKGCLYKHYQNPDIDSFISKQCTKNYPWLLQRNVDDLKYRFLAKERETYENR